MLREAPAGRVGAIRVGVPPLRGLPAAGVVLEEQVGGQQVRAAEQQQPPDVLREDAGVGYGARRRGAARPHQRRVVREADGVQHIVARHILPEGVLPPGRVHCEPEAGGVVPKLVDEQRLVRGRHEGELRHVAQRRRHAGVGAQEAGEQDVAEAVDGADGVGHRAGGHRRADGHVGGGARDVGEHQHQPELRHGAQGAAQADEAVGGEHKEQRRQAAHGQQVEEDHGGEVGARGVGARGALAPEQQPVLLPQRQAGQAHQRLEEDDEEEHAKAALDRGGGVLAQVEEDAPQQAGHKRCGAQVEGDEHGVAHRVAQLPRREHLELRPGRRLVLEQPAGPRALDGRHGVRVLHANHHARVRLADGAGLEGGDQPAHLVRRALDDHVQHVIDHVDAALRRRVAQPREEALRRGHGAAVHDVPRFGHQRHALDQPQDVWPRLVEAHHDGDAAGGQPRQQVHHVGRVGGVQPRGGLVQKQHPRAREQLRGDADPALLAA
mmetsp:Transcript_15898/g.40674  ORF Transcript_15898/g.40674 Transcript_15898/m.40674 type:complete len:494 (+) Transcript_15898:41-1522(+)